MTNTLPWLVIGHGAIGSLVASRLVQLGYPVELKLRPEQAATNTKQLQLSDDSLTLKATTELSGPRWIFAAVKAYQVEPLMAELKQSQSFQESRLVISYNGMLTNEAQLFGDHDAHWVTTHGAYREGSQVVHAGQGQSWIGSQNPNMTVATELREQLAQALPPLEVVTSIATRRWLKLAVNCLINPYTLLHQCSNGQLEEQVTRQQWTNVAQEITQLAHHHGIRLTTEDILEQAGKVVAATAKNRSSMLQDFLQGRTTEIDYLNGFVATASTEAGLAAPHNYELWQQVKRLSRARDLQ